MSGPRYQPRGGTVRWMDEARPGEWRYCDPGAPYYSTALFLAEDVWSDADQGWRPVYKELDDGDSQPENVT